MIGALFAERPELKTLKLVQVLAAARRARFSDTRLSLITPTVAGSLTADTSAASPATRGYARSEWMFLEYLIARATAPPPDVRQGYALPEATKKSSWGCAPGSGLALYTRFKYR